jgi:signal peptidase II
MAEGGKHMNLSSYWTRVVVILVTLFFCVGCDQKTKSIARDNLRGLEAKSFLHDTLRLHYAENSGGFLGLGDSLPPTWRTAIFSFGCSIGIAVGLLYVLFAVQLGRCELFAVSLLVAGGIGNLIDRWTLGYSTDFLNLGIGPLRTGIFNVADVAIMSGCFLILWTYRQQPSETNDPRSISN